MCMTKDRHEEFANVITARRFIYIEDICSGIIRCIENYKNSPQGIFNLTGERLVSLEEIVELCKKSLKKELKVNFKLEVILNNFYI